MNGTIIHELYYGGIYPFESIVPTDPNYCPLEQKINEERKALKEKLSKEDGERMDDLSDLYRESSTMYGYTNFSHGLKLGALLMCEILGSRTSRGLKSSPTLHLFRQQREDCIATGKVSVSRGFISLTR